MRTMIRRAGVVALTGLATYSQAATIVSANFNIADSVDHLLNGTTLGLQTNLGGGNWQGVSTGNSTQYPVIQNSSSGAFTPNRAQVLGGMGLAIKLDTPSDDRILSLSGKLTWGGSGNDMALGFWSTPAATSATTGLLNNFSGIRVSFNATTPSLALLVDGVQVGSAATVSTPMARRNAGTPGGDYPLSFDVNTQTGDISNIVFNGQSVADFATTSFNNTRTAWAGFADPSVNFAWVDDLNVTSSPVPEPSALSALAIGSLLLCRRRR